MKEIHNKTIFNSEIVKFLSHKVLLSDVVSFQNMPGAYNNIYRDE